MKLALRFCLTIVFALLPLTSHAGINQWTLTGPDGGPVDAVALSPDYETDKTVFAGTAAGLFKSTDRGSTWKHVSSSPLKGWEVQSIAVSPNFRLDDTIFTGAYNGGCFKSTDGGITWKETGYSDSNIKSIVISPEYSVDQTVFVQTAYYIFKSTNGGDSFALARPEASTLCVSISPDYMNDHTLFAGTASTIYKSTDGGTTWTPSGTGLPASRYVNTIAFSTTYSSDRTVFAGIGGGVYISTDGGANWALYGMSGQWILSLAVSPGYSYDGQIFAGWAGMWKTMDRGANWTSMFTGNIYSIAISPSRHEVFVATDDGVLKSSDSGFNFSYSNKGLKAVIASDIAFSPNYALDNTIIFNASSGTYKSTDGGGTWAKSPYPPNSTGLSFSPAYATDRTVFSGIYKSTDGGIIWGYSGGPNNVVTAAVSPNFATDRTVYAGSNGDGVYKSTNAGSTWVQSCTGLGNYQVRSVVVSPAYASDQTVFAGTYGGGVYRSTFAGASWSAPANVTTGRVLKLAISPAFSSDRTIFAGLDASSPVWKSVDGGANWTRAYTGIPAADGGVPGLSVSPNFASDHTVYATTWGGKVYKSTDAGSSWTLAYDPKGGSAGTMSLPPLDAEGTPSINSIGEGSSGSGSLAMSPTFTYDKTVMTSGGGTWSIAAPYGDPELRHYNWNAAMSGGNCSACHVSPGSFLAGNYRRDDKGFCYSCHNLAGNAHDKGIGNGGHAIMLNVTAGDRLKLPSYGNTTTGEKNNQVFSRLKDNKKMLCVSCHNIMQNPEDWGRVWERTTTSDRKVYTLQRGGWQALGFAQPKVYRDTTLWSPSPTYSKSKKGYLVDPSEYSYDEKAGTITFKSTQPSSAYVYVTVDYPHLRATLAGNALCSDCHTLSTHNDINCMNCHQAHNTPNIKGIRERVRTTNATTIPVQFKNYSKANSFADGDGTHDGICEVCHTQTRYYRRDGTGFANHSGGHNYDGKNCVACHTHSTGFAK